jgi:Thiopurine S-methyltransferase (TPMT)
MAACGKRALSRGADCSFSTTRHTISDGNRQSPRDERRKAATALILPSTFQLSNPFAFTLCHRAHLNVDCVALFTRYNRYIVVHQQLNPLQISYRPVTPVTSFSINNLIGNKRNILASLAATPSLLLTRAYESNMPRPHSCNETVVKPSGQGLSRQSVCATAEEVFPDRLWTIPFIRHYPTGDFFQHPLENSPFDVVCERTFLSALPPNIGKDYASRMRRLIRPNGKLMVFFLYGEDPEPSPATVSEEPQPRKLLLQLGKDCEFGKIAPAENGCLGHFRSRTGNTQQDFGHLVTLKKHGLLWILTP